MSIVSTMLVLVVIGYVIVNMPGWPLVQEYFLDAEVAARTAPKIVAAFGRNVTLFLLAEVFVLFLGLAAGGHAQPQGPGASRRSAPSPSSMSMSSAACPASSSSTSSVSACRRLGFPKDEFFWGLLALVLIYSAYVSEVYRAGIESVHPSQERGCPFAGPLQWQAMRFVVIPQAVRRIIPPLLNDFIGLTKDTALVSLIGLVEAFRRAQIEQAAAFNFTPTS